MTVVGFSGCIPEAAEKTAEQLDGLTVGGEKDGAKGEGMYYFCNLLIVELEFGRLGDVLDNVLVMCTVGCGSPRSFLARVHTLASDLIHCPWYTTTDTLLLVFLNFLTLTGVGSSLVYQFPVCHFGRWKLDTYCSLYFRKFIRAEKGWWSQEITGWKSKEEGNLSGAYVSNTWGLITDLLSNLVNKQTSSASIYIMLLFQEKPEVVVEKIVRNKRKCVTIIKGLDMFGECNVISLPILILL
jgi:hypothetical protein